MYFPYSKIKLLRNKTGAVERQSFISINYTISNLRTQLKNRLTNIYNTKRLNTTATDHSARRPTNFLVYSYNSAKCFTPHLLPLNTTVSNAPSTLNAKPFITNTLFSFFRSACAEWHAVKQEIFWGPFPFITTNWMPCSVWKGKFLSSVGLHRSWFIHNYY